MYCPRCKRHDLKMEDFSFNSKAINGRQSNCKECLAKRNRLYRKENKDKIKKYENSENRVKMKKEWRKSKSQ